MFIARIVNSALLFLCFLLCSCGLVRQQKLSKAKNQQYLTASNYTYTIPFKFINDYIIVTVAIAGESYDFLFDTAAPLCIDASLAARLDKDYITKKGLSDAYGVKRQLEIYSLPDIGLAGVKWFKVPFYSFNFIGANESSGLNVAGVFGASLMKDAIWQIDYQKQEITLTDQINSLKTSKTATSLDFERTTTESPTLNISVADESASVVLDTGSPYAFNLKESEFIKLKKEGSPIVRSKTSIFGQVTDSSLQIPNSTIILNKQEAFNNVTIQLHSALSESIMGNEFLKKHKLTIDWIYNTVHFEAYE